MKWTRAEPPGAKDLYPTRVLGKLEEEEEEEERTK